MTRLCSENDPPFLPSGHMFIRSKSAVPAKKRDEPIHKMKKYLFLAIATVCLGGCDARVNTAPPVTEKNTTIVNPPAKEEKKVENNTTIVNPSAPKEEKKTESTTVTTPNGTQTEKKTSETTK
jgi:hypothetical protein